MENVGLNGKLFLIPQDPRDREIILSSDRRAAAELRDRCSILFDYDWQCNTIANTMIEAMIQYLNRMLQNNEIGRGAGIDFYNIFSIIVSIKNNDDAEKQGNINIVFKPGNIADALIENGPDAAADCPLYTTEAIPVNLGDSDDAASDRLYREIACHVGYMLNSRNGILIPPSGEQRCFVQKITGIFMINVFRDMLHRLALEKNEHPDLDEWVITLNLNDNIEIHAVMDEHGTKFVLRPGMNAKLTIKCDEVTEHTMGD